MKKNRIIALSIAATILGGGTLSAPAIINAMVPTYGVTIQSASVKKTDRDLGDFKAGTKYCSLRVKHRDSNITASVPAPVKACDVVKKGQELTIKANKVVSGLGI